ncbi:hypothetical protein EVAR_59770_1 [Eumeta japonica]|uniref:Uncharacterized protein n=1 Tax=Eumeta variegata TaxID=151549 RepID=A0A4C1ZIW9_EUMVA|nr:hypothetical protein EVAR_59770_1 [Eumeta japonica]
MPQRVTISLVPDKVVRWQVRLAECSETTFVEDSCIRSHSLPPGALCAHRVERGIPVNGSLERAVGITEGCLEPALALCVKTDL